MSQNALTETTGLEKKAFLWGEHPFPSEVPKRWIIGPLRLWLKSVNNELWIAYQHRGMDSSEEPVEPDLPADLVWSRWALSRSFAWLSFAPIFPNRPILVKPEQPFRVPAGGKARIYARIPLWLKIEVGKKSRVQTIEIPIVVLSNTWFGQFTSGELCYWISTSARRQIEADPSRPYLAICPIQISNDSGDELYFEKMCLRVQYLSLYLDEQQLWSDETRIRYRGKDESSEIDYSGRVPSDAKDAKLISAARDSNKKGIVAKTFSTLVDLPGLGFLSK